MGLFYWLFVPPRLLFYGTLSRYHTNRAIAYGEDYPHALAYHRDAAHYYYEKMSGKPHSRSRKGKESTHS